MKLGVRKKAIFLLVLFASGRLGATGVRSWMQDISLFGTAVFTIYLLSSLVSGVVLKSGKPQEKEFVLKNTGSTSMGFSKVLISNRFPLGPKSFSIT